MGEKASPLIHSVKTIFKDKYPDLIDSLYLSVILQQFAGMGWLGNRQLDN